MATFTVLRHPVTVLVKFFTKTVNFTNDLPILKLLIVEYNNLKKTFSGVYITRCIPFKPGTRPPSCTTPRQPTIYIYDYSTNTY